MNRRAAVSRIFVTLALAVTAASAPGADAPEPAAIRPAFGDKVLGAFLGGAVGEGMGAPVEGKSAKFIKEKFGAWDFHQFIPNQGGRKGDGRITDDTLLAEALMRAYLKRDGHMDAYDWANFMLPEIMETVVYVPEYQKEMPIFERLWYPEKYPYLRLAVARADPRSAGVGNMVNCGVAMYIWPVGAMNAGDPEGAYAEAAALALAHNESFAVEAAAVMAAAAAEAFAADASLDRVLGVAQKLARDGTRQAIEACLRAAEPGDALDDFIRKTRAAVAPFDQRTGHTSDDTPLGLGGVSDTGRPSRLFSIEELPVALAALKYGGGDYLKTLRACVFYGRDNDSMAGMACSLCAALRGPACIPESLRTASARENRRDFSIQAAQFAALCQKVSKLDEERWSRRRAATEN